MTGGPGAPGSAQPDSVEGKVTLARELPSITKTPTYLTSVCPRLLYSSLAQTLSWPDSVSLIHSIRAIPASSCPATPGRGHGVSSAQHTAKEELCLVNPQKTIYWVGQFPRPAHFAVFPSFQSPRRERLSARHSPTNLLV